MLTACVYLPNGGRGKCFYICDAHGDRPLLCFPSFRLVAATVGLCPTVCQGHYLTLWTHFAPVQAAGLKLIQEAMSLPELKMLDTRWLSHKASVSTLLRSLLAVLVTLQQQSDPTALGLYKVATRYRFCASVLLLKDVLTTVTRLSMG